MSGSFNLFGGGASPPPPLPGLIPPAPVAAAPVAPAAPALAPLSPAAAHVLAPAIADGAPVDLAALRATLRSDDRLLLNAVAAEHLRYGQVEEALAILQMNNRLWPDDAQTLRLMAQCFVALEQWDAAEATMDAFERVSPPGETAEGDVLRRAVIMLRRYGVDAARSAFHRFVDQIGRMFSR